MVTVTVSTAGLNLGLLLINHSYDGIDGLTSKNNGAPTCPGHVSVTRSSITADRSVSEQPKPLIATPQIRSSLDPTSRGVNWRGGGGVAEETEEVKKHCQHQNTQREMKERKEPWGKGYRGRRRVGGLWMQGRGLRV